MSCNRIKISFNNTAAGSVQSVELPEGTTLEQAKGLIAGVTNDQRLVATNPGGNPTASGSTVLENGARVSSTPQKVAGATA